ncbi:dipicolinate synthase subunit DpsA [Tissierella sp. Yu-01]|uniref:dipicolinate synthase subunit DpsA n=1 Tax=Tissierella sp. Yu-01 TaxID=3035694 RepID=UPI00240D6AED|nr:dipicolinate synthase subunit DpsA [Tissierella sp. Yu-01]WFA10019.1 dipicolinate synthase subunit DpsA [Tissierella sp. Yu-01]
MGKKFTILGGDKRSAELVSLLKMDGHEVIIYGCFNKLIQNEIEQFSLEHSIRNSDVIIGPLPFSSDNIMVNAPHFTGRIPIEEVLNLINDKQILTAGKISKTIKDKAVEKDIVIADYFEREEMQVLNAIPTAEGAIQVAMKEMPITLHNSNIIVLGYGRIGKILSKMLYGIGANVHVEARSYDDLAWIKSNGFIPVNLKEINAFLPKMNVVFNTVPFLILDKELLSSISKDCTIIDLASKPGGVDLNIAEELELKVISALGLPGKVAPVTAAKVIKDTIYNIIEELEV